MKIIKPRFIPLLASITAAAGFYSCAPTSGPAVNSNGQVNTITAKSDLVSQGLAQFLTIKKQKRISTNAAYNAQVQRVANRLKQIIVMPNAQWEFVVFEDPTPNAFALPGGKVGIHTGLLPITKTDAGLAAVLGHEIAHVTRNHAGSRKSKTVGLALGGLILDQVAKYGGAGTAERATLGTVYGTGAAIGYALPNSRKNELEADRVGAIYMAKAGYDPNEAVAMWQRFADYNKKNGGSSTPAFLRTHPLDDTRINALRTYLPTALREYKR